MWRGWRGTDQEDFTVRRYFTLCCTLFCLLCTLLVITRKVGAAIDYPFGFTTRHFLSPDVPDADVLPADVGTFQRIELRSLQSNPLSKIPHNAQITGNATYLNLRTHHSAYLEVARYELAEDALNTLRNIQSVYPNLPATLYNLDDVPPCLVSHADLRLTGNTWWIECVKDHWAMLMISDDLRALAEFVNLYPY